MQVTESIKLENRQRKVKKSIGTPQFSSYGLIYRSGKVEIKNLEKDDTKKQPDVIDFSNWCMPEQPEEYIKCKRHDFL
jgi:hypothetical protein